MNEAVVDTFQVIAMVAALVALSLIGWIIIVAYSTRRLPRRTDLPVDWMESQQAYRDRCMEERKEHYKMLFQLAQDARQCQDCNWPEGRRHECKRSYCPTRKSCSYCGRHEGTWDACHKRPCTMRPSTD